MTAGIEKITNAIRTIGGDAVLISSADNRLYAAEISTSAGMVFVTAAGEAYFLTDSRYIEVARRTLAPKGFTVIDNTLGYAEAVNTLIQKHNVKVLAVEGNKITYEKYREFSENLKAEIISCENSIDILRATLSYDDMLKVKAAQEISERALMSALDLFRPGMTERELTAELIYHMIRFGADAPAFDPEIISGVNTSMPHGHPSDKPIVEGDMLLIDFGAAKDGYWSDCSRTFAVGYATDEMYTVYNTVLAAQIKAIDHFAAGVTGKELDNVARSYILNSGVEGCYEHALGHDVGLLKHITTPPLKLASRLSDSVFAPGNIMTFEPGIYQAGKIGCRIEDMVWLGKNNRKINLAEFPKEQLLILR